HHRDSRKAREKRKPTAIPGIQTTNPTPPSWRFIIIWPALSEMAVLYYINIIHFSDPYAEMGQPTSDAGCVYSGAGITFDESFTNLPLLFGAAALDESESWLDGPEIARRIPDDTSKPELKEIMNLLEPDKLFREEGEDTESADHAGVVVKFLHTSRAFSVLHVIDWFSDRETSSLVAILDPKGFRTLTLDIPVSETLEQIVAVVTTPEPKLDPPSKRARFTGVSQLSPTRKPQSTSTEAPLTKPHSDGARTRGGKKESK
ncbi:hypothetical protein DFH08DRAFT_1034474, partial [Mycena albidolilacea]